MAGLLAIVLAALVLRLRSSSVRRADVTWWWLACFLSVASLGELLRPDLRLGNVSTFVSIGAFYLIGSAVGRDLADQRSQLHSLPALLIIYTAWYLWIAVFYARGDLGFYVELPGTNLARLEFREGYAATEIPIYIGLQVPILIYALLFGSAALRVWAVVLLVGALTMVIASLSAGALAAMVLIVGVFLVSFRGLNWWSSLRALGAVAVLSAALSFSGNLVSSVTGKIQDFVVGEGVRALTYAQLVTDIAESPLGIGKGRFVETNNFSWLGQGVYPHNNLLGIGAELGVPALVLFVGFLLSAAIRLVRHGVNGRGRLPEPLRMVAVAALAMLVYQQFRGLLQDTWVIRETYFWVGLGLGTLSQRLDHSTASEYQRGS
jgi:O-antigen ligase